MRQIFAGYATGLPVYTACTNSLPTWRQCLSKKPTRQDDTDSMCACCDSLLWWSLDKSGYGPCRDYTEQSQYHWCGDEQVVFFKIALLTDLIDCWKVCILMRFCVPINPKNNRERPCDRSHCLLQAVDTRLIRLRNERACDRLDACDCSETQLVLSGLESHWLSLCEVRRENREKMASIR